MIEENEVQETSETPAEEAEVQEQEANEETSTEEVRDEPKVLARMHKAEKRVKDLEAKVESLAQPPAQEDTYTVPTQEEYTDTERALKDEMESLRTEFTKKELLEKYPILKDKWDDFEEFRSESENAEYSLNSAAKLYLVEGGLLEQVPQRKGVEKQTGGVKLPPKSGKMSAEDAKALRDTNYRKYMELVQSGKLQVE